MKRLVLIILLLGNYVLQAQEAGLPFMRTYLPKEFKGESQTFTFLQDCRNGLLYVANGSGVLEFDGVRWRLISVNRNKVLSLVQARNGTIYVCGINEIGYLAPDKKNQLHYISLLPKIPAPHRKISYAWDSQVIDDRIYFQLSDKILTYDGKQFTVIPAATSFQRYSFILNNRLLTNQTGKGLCFVQDNRLVSVPGTEELGSLQVAMVVAVSPGKWLIGTDNKGLYIFENGRLQPFNCAVNKLLKNNRLYRFAPLPDGTLALATLKASLIIIDYKGNIVNRFTSRLGLPDESIISVFPDREKHLWVGTNNGITRLEYPGAFTYFPEGTGLRGTIQAITGFNNLIYVATYQGVYQLQKQTPAEQIAPEANVTAFKKVPGLTGDFWALLPLPDKLLAGGLGGVYAVTPRGTSTLMKGESRSFCQSRRNPNVIFVGFKDGLGYLRFEQNKLVESGRIPGTDMEIRSIVEDKDGKLWLGTLFSGVQRVNISAGFTKAIVENFGLKDGLYVLQDNEVFWINNRLLLGTPGGFRIFDAKTQKFKPDFTFGKAYADSTKWVYRMYEASNKDIWMNAYNITETVVQHPAGPGKYKAESLPFKRHKYFPVYSFYLDNQQVAWMGGPDGLIRYDGRRNTNATLPFKAAIRQVLINNDSLLYGGVRVNASPVKLPYRFNSLRFETAALFYDELSENEYQYQLEGYEENWSGWTKEPQRMYTNLPNGNYTFKVRGRNIYGQVSQADLYHFNIVPPWYRTWWAKIIALVLLLTGGTYVVRYFATRKLIRRVEELELLQRVQKERERISSDLHDHVGAQLTSIISGLEMTEHFDDLRNNHKVKTLVDSLKEDARTTMVNLRDTIWTLDKEAITLGELVERVEKFAQTSTKYRIKPKYHINSVLSPQIVLVPAKALHIMRIIEEAIHNILKHADADNFYIKFLQPAPGAFTVEIMDDGRGFLPATPNGSDHYGLQNMQKRAQEIGGTYDIFSEPGKGTVIKVLVAL